MSSRIPKKDFRGRPIRTSADYARMMATTFLNLAIVVALFFGARYVDQHYKISEQADLPSWMPDAVKPYVIPGIIALLGFGAALAVITAVFSRFYRDPKKEVDEYGMYIRRD